MKRMQRLIFYLVRVVIATIALYVIAVTVLFPSWYVSLKQSHIDSNLRICTQEKNKLNESVYESLDELISKTDILVTTIEHKFKDSVKDTNNFNKSLYNSIVHLKKLLAQIENIQEENDVTMFLAQPIINNHNFSYIHNPEDTCSKSKIDVLLVLPSAPANFKKREVARNKNRGDYVRNVTNNARMLFFLGRLHVNTTLQQKIDNESETFRDIVQEDFEDVYTNNRLKSVSMLRWASTYCQNTKYVIRTDDDITINISLLVSTLDRIANKMGNFILGRQRVNDAPERKTEGKYYLSIEEYPQSTFPPYLLGGVLGYPIRTAKLLYEAALRVKPIWLEDIFISALCATKVHVPIVTDPSFNFKHPWS